MVRPSGSVTFFDGSLPLGTVDVSDAGGTATASLDTSGLLQGPHFVTATYSGDPTYATSTTVTPVTVDVAEAPTSVTVSDASARSVVGQTVVLTASIASPAPGPTGTVQFADNGEPIGSGAVSGGQATLRDVVPRTRQARDHGRLRGRRQLHRRLVDGHAHADGRPGRDGDRA